MDWHCGACTLINKESTSVCVACRSPRCDYSNMTAAVGPVSGRPIGSKPMPAWLSVGGSARCSITGPGGKAQRCRVTICDVDRRTSIVEVLRQGASRNLGTKIIQARSLDEINVPLSVLTPLEDFEQKKTKGQSADKLKVQGNALFKLKDYQAAEERYMQALSMIRGQSYRQTCGTMLARIKGNMVRVVRDSDAAAATKEEEGSALLRPVAIIDGGRQARVFFVRVAPRGAGAAGERVQLRLGQVLAFVPSSGALRALQVALHLNVARCCLHLEEGVPALWHSQIAIAIACEPPHDRVMELKALILRAKAYLKQAQPRHARRDCIRAAALADKREQSYTGMLGGWASALGNATFGGSGAGPAKLKPQDEIKHILTACTNKQVRVLAKGIEKALKKSKRTNKVIAKELSKWLDLTMTKNPTMFANAMAQ